MSGSSGPNPRNPYRHGTPPYSNARLPGTPPYAHLLLDEDASSGDNYPESPVKGHYRRYSAVDQDARNGALGLGIGGSSSGSSNGGGGTMALDTPPGSPKPKKHKLRRRCRFPTRTVMVLVFLGVAGAVFRTWRSSDDRPLTPAGRIAQLKGAVKESSHSTLFDDDNDGAECRFESTVDAYFRDLKRLRRLVAERQNMTVLGPGESSFHESARYRHRFSPTGHLLMADDEEGTPHPIPLLLQMGEKKWGELLARQSRTLGEAVTEYTRRYGRRPPKGFDMWWEYAEEARLVLPDEYDRINLDLAPFFALPKEEMKRRISMVEDMPEVFTLVVDNGDVSIQIKDAGSFKWEGTWPRANDAGALIGTFADMLPNMRATFSIFDQPQIYLSWARRGSLVDLGLKGLHTSHLQETDDGHVRLSRSCAPDSNFRQNPNMTEGRSFIYDSLEATDICQNPYLIPRHGLTLEPHEVTSHPRPHTQLLPLFSLAKTSINSDILITPLDQFFNGPGHDPAWEDKSSSKLAWRGSPTGISMMTRDLNWRDSHRVRLHHFANNRSSAPTSYFGPDVGQKRHRVQIPGEDAEDDELVGVDLNAPLHTIKETMNTKIASNFFFDMKLAGQPIQCSEEDGTCKEMRQEIEWAPYQSAEALNQNKFLLDIDGNGWSARFRRLMSTNSVVIKAGIFTEWFQPHLIPWFMYIPSKLDFSDLMDILSFFRGTPRHPDLGFDETARAIAMNGKCFVRRMFRLEDMQAYMLRLFLEYARLVADEDVDMDFHYKGEGGLEDILDTYRNSTHDEELLQADHDSEARLQQDQIAFSASSDT